jgi:cytochrome P450
VHEIDLSDPAVLRDPFAAYRAARERGPVARLVTPGFGSMWAVTGYHDARAMLSDPRFELTSNTYLLPGVPEHCVEYMHTMQEKNGAEHARLRRLVSPAFTARRAAEFRSRIEPIVERLLDDLPGHAVGGTVDLLAYFARPLPIDVIGELVGIDPADRATWREYGAAVAAGHGEAFAAAIPGIMRDSMAAVARRTTAPGADLLSELIGMHAADEDRLSDVELVTLVWHLVLTGQTPALLIANAVEALLEHPEQLAALRSDPGLDSPRRPKDQAPEAGRVPGLDSPRRPKDQAPEAGRVPGLDSPRRPKDQAPEAGRVPGLDSPRRPKDQAPEDGRAPGRMPEAVEELTRWCGPQLLSLPRFASADVEFAGVRIGKGEPVTAALAGANRDPRVFPDPDRLDLRRPSGRPAHLGYAHGPHFCLGAALARVQTEVALAGLLRRFPGLALPDGGAQRIPDPGAWRLTTLSVTLGPSLRS